jgi:signal peptidase I
MRDEPRSSESSADNSADFVPYLDEQFLDTPEKQTVETDLDSLDISEGDVDSNLTPRVETVKAGKRGGLVREIIETAIIALLIFAAVRAVVLNFRVDGTSMMPNLINGEMLIVNRNAYKTFDLYGLVDWVPGVEHADAKDISPFSSPHRGDIIVFDPPVNSNKPYIKRIIGLPGETVEVKNGGVYIDGELLDEPYIEAGITDCSGQYCGPVTLDDSQIWVMGDNRRNSSDSRSFGPAQISSVEGEAIVTYWPLSEVSHVGTVDYDDQQ